MSSLIRGETTGYGTNLLGMGAIKAAEALEPSGRDNDDEHLIYYHKKSGQHPYKYGIALSIDRRHATPRYRESGST